MKPCTGTYALILHNKRAQTIAVGKLGTFFFPLGCYVYSGSAFGPGGLPARTGRHLKPHKPLRWHIDYLTACSPGKQTDPGHPHIRANEKKMVVSLPIVL